MCAAQGRMYVGLVWLAHALSAPHASSLFIYRAELHELLRDTGTLGLLGLCTPYTPHARRASFSNAALSHMCTAQGCMYAWLAWLVCILHTTPMPRLFSFALISYMCAAHGLPVRFLGLACVRLSCTPMPIIYIYIYIHGHCNLFSVMHRHLGDSSSSRSISGRPLRLL